MKKTKTALLHSAVALLLCVSMLAGTTYAWFTDNVSSVSNIITSGNLDVEMYYTDDLESGSWKDASDCAVFNYDNWEPGYTEVRYIKIVNAGSLAFRYRMSIIPEGEVGKLAEVIDLYYLEKPTKNIESREALAALTPVSTLRDALISHRSSDGVLLPAGDKSSNYDAGEVIVAVAMKMKEDAGNDYQNESIGDGFAIQLMATQFNYESDSFGDDYDKDATFPELNLPVEIWAPVTPTADGKVPAGGVQMQNKDGSVKVTVPAGATLKPGITGLAAAVKEMNKSDANIVLGDNQILRSLDVHVDGLAEGNTVPALITIEKALMPGLNLGNYQLYHVEKGASVPMVLVTDTPDAHNEFTYDPVTGDVTLAMATFSEVAVVSDTENAWEGNFDYSWYTNAVAPVGGEAVTEYIIANADQLAAFGAIVGGMDGQTQNSFSGKDIKLVADINLGDKESENNTKIIFYPIGYYNSEGTYERTNTAITSGLRNFEGTFDGNGHTISNFYQNTWEMKGDHDWYAPTDQYYRDGMGLFGKVYDGTVKNLTVSNFSSDGEIATTGVIAAYAEGATFENIAITNCNPRVYNIGNGGIVGCVGWYAKEADLKTTFTNITVDNTNKISALWGSYDVACGGIVGQYYPTSGQTSADTPKNGGIDLVNCHVAAVMDVYNDVCGNYQYYAYRYAGMIIGSIRENTTNEDGKTIPDMTGISATGCTVNYGDWNDYYYCEFEKNGHPSYSGPDDYKFSRVPHSELEFTDSNGNGLVDANERASVTGCKHNHTDAENNKAIYLPFHQLFTGYGWGVNSIGLEKYSGIVTNLDITEGDQEESVVKFKGNVDKLENNTAIKFSEIFSSVESTVEISDFAVTIAVTNLDENNSVSANIVYDSNNWENGTITLTGTGKVQITIQDYYFCTPTTITVNVTERQAAEKFDVVMNNGDFLHRVGNIGTVALDKLFDAKDGVTVGTVSVTVEAVNGTAASGAYTSNATWTNGTIQFSGTGVVKVTITDNDYCTPTELYLEVVDAVNATGATNATSNNVVLLNDCGFSSLEVSGGYALYGNGFTMTCGSDSAALDMGYSFVTLNNGTLDNVQIVCPNFDYAALYKSNLTSGDNRSETTDKTRYYNAKSGVMASGNSQILNSRISGGRAAVNVSGGNVVIDNSRIELGAVASILVGSANSLTLRDVTLVQKPTASTYDSNKKLMGFSVLYLCDSEGKATPTTLEGSFVQQAWVNADDKQYVPSVGKDIVDGIMNETAFIHDINGKDSLNLGFAYMPEDAQKTVAAPDNITDNRTDKATIPYEMKDVKIQIAILSTTVYVYSYKNTNGTDDSFKTESKYVPNRYSDIITVSYSDTADGLTTGKSFDTDGWVYELNVDLDKLSDYALDFSKLSMTVNGVAVTDFKVDGSTKPTSPVAVTAGGITYTLTATVNDKEYTATYKVTGTETSKESPSLVGTPSYGAGFGVANKYGGDWSAAAPVLDGITIKYWSVADSEYKEFALSSITFANTGKQNETNNYWEYTHTNNDFTLKLTNTAVIHSSSGTYGMPVAGEDGKLYFTIASSNGFVSAKTTSRSITIAYEFTDNNGGDTLKFSHTWSISYNKEDQYDYNSFTSDGTLTKLKAGSGGGPCVTPDTLVTLADGTQKRVDALTGNEMLLVWNHETGSFDRAPVAYIVDHDGYVGENVITHLYFDNGYEIKIIGEHVFFDSTLNKYVAITTENAESYIGHSFAVKSGDTLATAKLVKADSYTEVSTVYEVVSYKHITCFTNNILSASAYMEQLLNIFDVNPETMAYNAEDVQKDIETYGLYTYADFEGLITEEAFELYNAQYLKIAVGKGYITWDDILELIDIYFGVNVQPIQ